MPIFKPMGKNKTFRILIFPSERPLVLSTTNLEKSSSELLVRKQKNLEAWCTQRTETGNHDVHEGGCCGCGSVVYGGHGSIGFYHRYYCRLLPARLVSPSQSTASLAQLSQYRARAFNYAIRCILEQAAVCAIAANEHMNCYYVWLAGFKMRDISWRVNLFERRNTPFWHDALLLDVKDS